MFWPEVSRRQDVEGKDVWVYDGLISLWRVSYTTWSQTSHAEINKAIKEPFFKTKEKHFFEDPTTWSKMVLNCPYYSPITSSFTSFHSISFPVSWAMVTVILLWMPCGVKRRTSLFTGVPAEIKLNVDKRAEWICIVFLLQVCETSLHH